MPGNGKETNNSMVTREELLQWMERTESRPLEKEELVRALGVTDEEKEAFGELLSSLEGEGKLVRTKKKKVALPKDLGLVAGVLQGHVRGFGFLVPDDPEEKTRGDVFIAPGDINGAMDRDNVLVRLYPNVRGNRREGFVERITVRNSRVLVGTYREEKGRAFLVPDGIQLGGDVQILDGRADGARDGLKVVVEITRWPREEEVAQARIREVLGKPGETGVEMMSIIRSFDLPYDFPAAVLEEARAVPDRVMEADRENRRDLRDLPMVTIDGADARDLDDAVSLSQDGGDWVLGVHIADVSHYVREGSRLDADALERATSVYFPDRVVPMLPEKLSNGICSLNAGEERLAMTCEMRMDSAGKVRSYEIYPSCIRVDERMTYEDVQGILQDDGDRIRRYGPWVDTFRKMAGLSGILRKRRLERGALDFDFPEVKVVLDDGGNVAELRKKVRNDAESIIEEFMIAANETVAEHLFWLEEPAVYRVHEEPSLEKIEKLNESLRRFGIRLNSGKAARPEPADYQAVLHQIQGEAYEMELSTMLLRSMMHARYLGKCTGHFGLASRYYCHFTSPIRRYPDLFVHRSLKRVVAQRSKEGREARQVRAERTARLSSERELVAEEAEREAVDLMVVTYMRDHVGDEFDAHISGVIASGFFVRLENLAEGLVRVTALGDDYYVFDEGQMALVGDRTGRIYRIGDPVRVRLVRADLARRQLDFEPAENGERHEKDRGKPKGKARLRRSGNHGGRH